MAGEVEGDDDEEPLSPSCRETEAFVNHSMEQEPRETILPPTHFCLGCGYPLDGLRSHRCPECGRAFDLKDAGTYSTNRRGLPLWLRRRVSIAVVVVIVNYSIFLLGVLLNSFGGWIDELGASLCVFTYMCGSLLAFLAILYSFVRRFHLPAQEWDLYGPGVAIGGWLLMYWLIESSAR